MKIRDKRHPLTLAWVALLSLTANAHAGHSSAGDHDPVKSNQVIHRDHAFRHERYEFKPRLDYERHEHHRQFRDKTWRYHRPQVVWQQPVSQPRLLIRLPWLIFVNY